MGVVRCLDPNGLVVLVQWNACVMMVVKTVAMKLRDEGEDGGQLR